MSTLIHGTNDGIKQGTRRTWNRYQGETVATVYTGPKTPIVALYASLTAFGGGVAQYDDISLDEMNGIGEVVASRGGASAETTDGDTVYELMANEVTRKIESAPYFLELTTPITVDEISKAYAVYNRTPFLADGNATPAPTALTGKTATLYGFLEAGIHEYYESSYVVRETKIVSQRSSFSASFTNVNRVSSPPSVGSLNALIGALPDGEWLKKAPQVRTYGDGRWQIVQEWWWATKWSSILYGGSLTVS